MPSAIRGRPRPPLIAALSLLSLQSSGPCEARFASSTTASPKTYSRSSMSSPLLARPLICASVRPLPSASTPLTPSANHSRPSHLARRAHASSFVPLTCIPPPPRWTTRTHAFLPPRSRLHPSRPYGPSLHPWLPYEACGSRISPISCH